MLERIKATIKRVLSNNEGHKQGEQGRIRFSPLPSSCEHLGEQGFTLIELIMVIVILGILAAAAVPKFMDLSGDAKQAAVKGFAAAMEGAGSANFAGCKVNNMVAGTHCKTGAACTNTFVGSLLDGGIPKAADGTTDAVTISQTTAGSTTTDTAFDCLVTGDTATYAGKTASFRLLPT